MVKVGIIDTEINAIQIQSKSISTKTLLFEPQKNGGHNVLHGTEVANVLVAMNSDITILGVTVLNENAKGRVADLITAINWCIEQKVDFINLSLGYSLKNGKIIKELHQVCKKAIENEIVVVAAEKNNNSEEAYPANFPEVISVDSDYNQNQYCNVIESKINFNFNVLYIEGQELKIREGNSYLVPFVIGILSHMYIGGIKKKDLLIEFKRMFSEINLKKIVVNSVNERFKNLIDKKVLYVTYGELDPNDKNIISYLKSITNLIIVCEIEKTPKMDVLQDVDAVVWGIGNYIETFNKRNEIRSLIKYCFNKTKCVISILPYFNFWERYQFTKDNNNQFISIYN